MAGERILPGVGLYGFWTLGDNTWKTGADLNWRLISALLQCRVLSFVTAIPGAPTNGDMHVLTVDSNSVSDDSNSGDMANAIIVRDNGEWHAFSAHEGFLIYNVADTTYYSFNGAAWAAVVLTVPPATAIPYDSTTDSNSTPTDVAGALDDIYTRVIALEGVTGGAEPFDIAFFRPGTPDANELMCQFVAVRACSFADEFANSQGFAGVTDASSFVITVKRSNTVVGLITFASSTSIATFTTAEDSNSLGDDSNSSFGAGALDLIAGDKLQFYGPASPGAWADISINLMGTR